MDNMQSGPAAQAQPAYSNAYAQPQSGSSGAKLESRLFSMQTAQKRKAEEATRPSSLTSAGEA